MLSHSYARWQEDSLNSLRYINFMEMVSSSKPSLDPLQKEQHIIIVYGFSLQVIIWKELSNNILDPKQ